MKGKLNRYKNTMSLCMCIEW